MSGRKPGASVFTRERLSLSLQEVEEGEERYVIDLEQTVCSAPCEVRRHSFLKGGGDTSNRKTES